MKKTQAFTLIELLVVIVIIGILATISTATFNGQIDKAKDVKIQAQLNEIQKAFIRDDLDIEDDSKYFYGPFGAANASAYLSTVSAVYSKITETGISFPSMEPDHCFHWASSGGTNASSGDDNNFAIIGWSDESSTHNPGQPGVIVFGTPDAIKAYNTSYVENNVTKEHFECGFNATRARRVIAPFYSYLCHPSSKYASQISNSFPGSGWVAGGNNDNFIFNHLPQAAHCP